MSTRSYTQKLIDEAYGMFPLFLVPATRFGNIRRCVRRSKINPGTNGAFVSWDRRLRTGTLVGEEFEQVEDADDGIALVAELGCAARQARE